MCWQTLLIDDSLVTRETQQSITVEEMSEKGWHHVTTATVVNVNGTNGTYHSLTGENKIGDMRMRGH
jgi:hypothetical protein